MKQVRLFIVTLFAAVLPMTVWADETELKVFESTFNGATYESASEMYATGTLTSSEGNDWTWNAPGESKSPILRMTEVGGEPCLSAKLKTSSLELTSNFSVPGKVQEIYIKAGGNLGAIQFDFGDESFKYDWRYTDSNLHPAGYGYMQVTVRVTLPGQKLNVVLFPRDANSSEPIYLQNFSISSEAVVSYGKNVIESIFTGFDEEYTALVAEDNAYNWLMALPYGNTTIESYPTMWNDEQCLYMRVTGGNSSYPKLTFTSAFPVLGKVKKIVVKAGGDFRVLSYTKTDGEEIWSEDATTNIPYLEDWILDFGDGIEMRDNLTFYFYTGRNTYLKSITIVMEDGEETEIEGILSTFYDWEEWETTDSYKTGRLKSKEGTPWQAKLYDPTTEVYATMLQENDDESTLEQCMVFVNNNSGDINFELTNLFDVAGPIKKIVVRYANPLYNIKATIYENGTVEGEQYYNLNPVQGYSMFSDAELLFDGTTEYTSANIKLTFEAGSLLFLQSITIIQKDDDGGGGEDQGGKCGENLNYDLTQLPYTIWVWDNEAQQSVESPAYKLTITGTGDMYDFSYDYDTNASNAPWMKDYQECVAEIELPDGLTHVGDYAFYAMYQAMVKEFPNSLTSIGEYAFYNLISWPDYDLRLPANLTSIGTEAFAFCQGLKNVYLPASLTSLGEGAIWPILDLENYYVDAANAVYKADGNAVIERATDKLIAGNKNTVIPDYVKSIGYYAFYRINTTEMTIPNSVTNIGRYAFGNSYITTVDIPSSVASIENYAFYSCRKLTDVTIGSNVTSMGINVFYNSTNILDIYCYADPETLTWRSSSNESSSFKPNKMTQMHVRAADLEKWQEKFGFLNVTFVGDLGGTVTPITEETTVAVSSLENENLNDNTVDGIYYNLDESTGSGYNNGCLVIGQTTDMSQVGDDEPGSEDVKNNFTGIIMKVGPGKGTITIDAAATGKLRLAVRIGDGTSTYAAHDERYNVYLSYNVTEPTNVYIYAVSPNGSLVKIQRAPAAGEDALLIYGIKVTPGDIDDAIGSVEAESNVKGQWYDMSGKAVATPRQSGIYIRNGRKIIMK